MINKTRKPSNKREREKPGRLTGLVCSGILIALISVSGQTEELLSVEELEKQNLVEVESNNVLPSELNSSLAIVPYKDRRRKWGHAFSVSYSFYKPAYYKSDYINPELADFELDYGSPQIPLIEISYTHKWNFSLGSLGGEMSYGYYSNDADDFDLLGDANLQLQMARVGVKFTMDNLFSEPIVAPYFSTGIYSVLYDETQGGASFNGTTGVAGYWAAGALFQLDWLDKSSAIDAYLESGIENTFLSVEVRQFLASSVEQDPDFSTDPDINIGISVEF